MSNFNVKIKYLLSKHEIPPRICQDYHKISVFIDFCKSQGKTSKTIDQVFSLQVSTLMNFRRYEP